MQQDISPEAMPQISASEEIYKATSTLERPGDPAGISTLSDDDKAVMIEQLTA